MQTQTAPAQRTHSTSNEGVGTALGNTQHKHSNQRPLKLTTSTQTPLSCSLRRAQHCSKNDTKTQMTWHLLMYPCLPSSQPASHNPQSTTRTARARQPVTPLHKSRWRRKICKKLTTLFSQSFSSVMHQASSPIERYLQVPSK